jgi:L-amino acid N-acyltransferase YncA
MTESDLTLVWKWRNHLHVRITSACEARILWEEHLNWFRNPSSSAYKLIFTENEKSIGVLTKNFLGYWSFYLDPDAPKRMGYGLILLSLAVAHCKRIGDTAIRARVKASNLASLQLHKQVGFKPISKKKGTYELLYSVR